MLVNLKFALLHDRFEACSSLHTAHSETIVLIWVLHVRGWRFSLSFNFKINKWNIRDGLYFQSNFRSKAILSCALPPASRFCSSWLGSKMRPSCFEEKSNSVRLIHSVQVPAQSWGFLLQYTLNHSTTSEHHYWIAHFIPYWKANAFHTITLMSGTLKSSLHYNTKE